MLLFLNKVLMSLLKSPLYLVAVLILCLTVL
nr:MAG TPA: hypothetical protein [Bacteriophage sp.]